MNIFVGDLRIVPALSLKGLPYGVTTPYIGLLPNGHKFAIFHPEVDWDYDSFRCVFSEFSACREVKVISVVRYRDGGTTDIKTGEGDFHFPSPFNKDDKPTFNGQEILLEER